ncbi:MAG: type II secretion system protein GspC [Gammaproteobacteria bacterium]|nr:MAG: type II secretion system protein GspC [Gammaproteobacteria bacterium]
MNLSTNTILNWGKNYFNWLPIIQWAGWITIAVLGAKLFWILFLHFMADDISNKKATLVSSTQSAQVNNSVDIGGLVSMHLFGDQEKAPVVVEDVENAPETRLNLKLRGIYAATNKSHSNSIIEDGKGKQAVYFIDDKLEVSGRVYLRNVYSDRVILETNGRKEVLSLKDSLPAEMKRKKSNQLTLKKSTNKKVQDKRKNKQISKSLNEYRKKLLENPMSLTDLVRMSPATKNGETIGYRISPGKDKRLFTQLGLRRNDVITGVNGMSLANPSDAMQLFGEIQNMQDIQVDILRGNENISLLLDLNNAQGGK